jgi:hypothetical protein
MNTRTKNWYVLFAIPFFIALMGNTDGCDRQVQSVSGTKMATAGRVATGSDGLTTEQRNINERIKMDNKVGAIKHLYVISAYSGQTLIYSTVKGKVTSSGKRLTPDRVEGGVNNFTFDIGGNRHFTDQVLGEDGTYGSSIEYLYWWDSKDAYHQHYVTGGQILHVSDQPLSVKSIVINMELTQAPTEAHE